MKFSILIPTLPSRLHCFTRLVEELTRQTGDSPIEIMAILDNRSMVLGDKRNELLSLSSGAYVAFFDDDDWPEVGYVSEILAAIETNPDVIVFDSIVTYSGKNPKRCVYGLELDYTETPELWTGKPAHTSVWKSEIAKSCKFPSKLYGEDYDWVAQAWPKAKTQYRIESVLYNYRFDRRTSETRKSVRR